MPPSWFSTSAVAAHPNKTAPLLWARGKDGHFTWHHQSSQCQSVGCPRHTWLRILEADLQPHNLGVNSAWRYAQDRACWKHYRSSQRHARVDDKSHWATSSPLIVWVYLQSNFRDWLRKPVYFEIVRNGRSRSSKVVDFGANRKRVCNFLYSSLVTSLLSCPVSEILQVFCWKHRRHPYFTRTLRVPLGLNCRRWGSEEQFIRIITFEVTQLIWPRHLIVTDRQTNKRLTIAILRYAHRVSRGKNKQKQSMAKNRAFSHTPR